VGLTDAELRERLLAMNENALETLYLPAGGEVIEDVDGIPTSVGATTREKAIMARPMVTMEDVQRTGLHPRDLPNLRIIDTKEQP
jgi:hypothetical protein